MAYSALALARTVGSGWAGRDVDLDDVEDLEALVELLHDLLGDDEPETVVLLVEEDDEWVGVVRTAADPGDDDLRAFLSDRRCLQTSALAARIFGEAVLEAADGVDPHGVDPDGVEDEEDEPAVETGPDIVPAGDARLLADLGTDGPALLALCAAEGALPGDVIAAVVEAAGAADVYERIRPA